MNQYYLQPSAWGNAMAWGSMTTSTSSTVALPNTATVTFDHVPVTPPPRTEIDLLLAEVEAVCAMAR